MKTRFYKQWLIVRLNYIIDGLRLKKLMLLQFLQSGNLQLRRAPGQAELTLE